MLIFVKIVRKWETVGIFVMYEDYFINNPHSSKSKSVGLMPGL